MSVRRQIDVESANILGGNAAVIAERWRANNEMQRVRSSASQSSRRPRAYMARQSGRPVPTIVDSYPEVRFVRRRILPERQSPDVTPPTRVTPTPDTRPRRPSYLDTTLFTLTRPFEGWNPRNRHQTYLNGVQPNPVLSRPLESVNRRSILAKVIGCCGEKVESMDTPLKTSARDQHIIKCVTESNRVFTEQYVENDADVVVEADGQSCAICLGNLCLPSVDTCAINELLHDTKENTVRKNKLQIIQRLVNIGILQTCGHYYHADCLRGWFYRMTSCPMCRVTSTEMRSYGLTSGHLMSIENVSNNEPLKKFIRRGVRSNDRRRREQPRNRDSPVPDESTTCKHVLESTVTPSLRSSLWSTLSSIERRALCDNILSQCTHDEILILRDELRHCTKWREVEDLLSQYRVSFEIPLLSQNSDPIEPNSSPDGLTESLISRGYDPAFLNSLIREAA